MQAEWNLDQLAAAAIADMAACHTPLERQLCRVINDRQIREAAARLTAIRKLTPGEAAIARVAGFVC